jgi:hypothetical protein
MHVDRESVNGVVCLASQAIQVVVWRKSKVCHSVAQPANV